jgi:iodotyrosine deiodinase
VSKPTLIPLSKYREYSEEEVKQRAAFAALEQTRRTVPDFSNRPVPLEIIENCIRAPIRQHPIVESVF